MKRTLRRNRFAPLAVAFGVAALWAGALQAQTGLQKFQEWEAGRSAFDVSNVNLGGSGDADLTLNVNNWLCGLRSDGSICVNTFGSTTGGGGFWPIGTTNQYVFLAGLQFAARDPLDPNGFVAAHCFNVSATNAQCGPLDGIFHSDVSDDLDNWPDTCLLANPQTGELVKSLSQLDTCARYWDGNPSFTVPGGHPMGVEIVQHTLTFTLEGFRDMLFFIFKIKNISDTPLFQSANPALAVPAGGWTLEDFYLAVGHDADVSGNDLDQNWGSFVPFLDDETALNIGTIWLGDFDATDFEPYAQCGFCSVPGFVGTTFLRSPHNNTGDTIVVQTVTTNVADTTFIIVPPIEQETLAELRELAAFGDVAAQDSLRIHEIGQSFGSNTTRGGVFPDPTDAAQSWRYYSGNLNASELSQIVGAPAGFGFVDQPAPADTRYFHATGPFDLAPGDSVEVVVGLVGGAPVLNVPGFTPGTLVPHGLPGDTSRIIEKIMGRGVETTAYPSLFKQVLDANNLFKNNFLLPSPPPAPVVTAIPGDQQNFITWGADPVNARDPFADIAENFSITDFNEFDFQGFRVYRKVRAADPWTQIAQFDLKDGVGAQIVTTDSVQVVDSSFLAVRTDTADFCVPLQPELAGQEAVACSTDTGLQFTLVDRGGRFPDAANGPGLLNGVTYFYAVTSFDINTPFAPGGSSLESGRRLSVASQAAGGAAATPRSTAAGRTAAVIGDPVLFDGDGNVLDPTGGMPAIDATTGVFGGAAPPTNSFAALVNLPQPALVQAGDYEIRIDSVVSAVGAGGGVQPATPNCLGTSTVYYLTATAPDGTATEIPQEVKEPFGLFGCIGTISQDISPVSVLADAAAANAQGVDPSIFVGSLGGNITYGPTHLMSQSETVASNRSHVVGPEGGSRWFTGDAPAADPTLGNATGSLPGVTIWSLPSQYDQDVSMRWLGVYTQSGLWRAADIEVTWGAGGTVAGVRDLTHNVDIPFSANMAASWGVLNNVNEDNILSAGDFWSIEPLATWLPVAGVAGSFSQTAVIGPMATVPPGSQSCGQFCEVVDVADTQGFGMFVAGEAWLFETSTLPAAGDVWKLRTYSGTVVQDSTTSAYSFLESPRPPPIPGLRAAVTVSSPETFDVASASLEDVHTVPNPFRGSSALQQASSDRKILFVNLPTQATIRIFTLSGVLVDAIMHEDPAGGGTANWDLRNRNNQFVASGVYFYHVSTPTGAEKLGRMTIIQAPNN
ncbi:MAG: hypothetical protein ABFS34_02280 [Gemmatimonadota bacterium]